MLFRALTVTFILIKVKKLLYIYVKQTRIFLFVPQWEKSKQKKKVKEVYVSYLPLTKERNIKKKNLSTAAYDHLITESFSSSVP